MYLVMTPDKSTPFVDLEIRSILNASGSYKSYEGESTKRIYDNLLKENNDCVIISADSRFLNFVYEFFPIEDVYIYANEQLIRLIDTTSRQLRPAHNLMKLYEAGEFNYWN